MLVYFLVRPYSRGYTSLITSPSRESTFWFRLVMFNVTPFFSIYLKFNLTWAHIYHILTMTYLVPWLDCIRRWPCRHLLGRVLQVHVRHLQVKEWAVLFNLKFGLRLLFIVSCLRTSFVEDRTIRSSFVILIWLVFYFDYVSNHNLIYFGFEFYIYRPS